MELGGGGVELEPRVGSLGFKVRAASRDSASAAHKPSNVLDPDLRTHWSTATNTKEWILLELDDTCLLSHIRIYNKSVLEWEITAGLQFKLFGISVSGLDPAFQPVVNHLLPHIISHKQDAHDMHLQLLQDITSRLLAFAPHLETDISKFADATETNLRFLAMLAGPLYPILYIAHERESMLSMPDSDALKNAQPSALTISSNFEVQPRRSRSPSLLQSASSSLAFRPDVVIMLLRKAHKDSQLGRICRLAARVLLKLINPTILTDGALSSGDLSSLGSSEKTAKAEGASLTHVADYSGLFGEDFKVQEDHCDTSCLNILDVAAVEEGIFHVVYACASQPSTCFRLGDSFSDFWSMLPLIQSFLPALRPFVTSPSDQIDDNFTLWKQSCVQRALSQIVTMLSSSAYKPLLSACAGYLASFSSSHAKAACVLIDLCSGPLAPWLHIVTAKVDLAIELLEDLLGVIQGARQDMACARASLKYIVLALSGQMDDVLAKYKEVKHKLLFLLEMLEPFLDPVLTITKNPIAFGDVSTMVSEKEETNCSIALNLIRAAVQRPAVLPYLESEWRRGSVLPSVLLSILGPHMALPPAIDSYKTSSPNSSNVEAFASFSAPNQRHNSAGPDESEMKIDISDATVKNDALDDCSYLFAPPELKKSLLAAAANQYIINRPGEINTVSGNDNAATITDNEFRSSLVLDDDIAVEHFNLQAEYLQLANLQECEFRASEFQQLAKDLCSEHDITPEGHDAAIDALLLAAECYVNPFFVKSSRSSKLLKEMKTTKFSNFVKLKGDSQTIDSSSNTVYQLEINRDKVVLQILLQAAKLDKDYCESTSQDEYSCDPERNEQSIDLSGADLECADAVTLVRQNQLLLGKFVMKQLQREQHTSREILFHSLLFLLQSATHQFCGVVDIIDVIIQSAEDINQSLVYLNYQAKDGKTQLNSEKLNGFQRRWLILQRLVIASSGTDGGVDIMINARNGFQYRCLVPPVSWMQQIPRFSKSQFPLVRFLGWMAVSRFAAEYLKERLFLASDFSHLTLLLSIFRDELARVENLSNKESMDSRSEYSVDTVVTKDTQESFGIVHPDLHKVLPNLNKQFQKFGGTILEAVGLQLKSLPSFAVPDLLCWYCDLCFAPYLESEVDNLSLVTAELKGFAATNAKAIILYLLESIVDEHMDVIIPEMPRVVLILKSLCSASYCDIALMDSVLSLLKPLISCFLRKVTNVEELLDDASSYQNFEFSGFEELFSCLQSRRDYLEGNVERRLQGSLMIFVFGSITPYLSIKKKKEILESLLSWTDFTSTEPTPSFFSYLCAFQKVIESSEKFLVANLKGFGVGIHFEGHESPESVSGVKIDSCISSPFSISYTANEICSSEDSNEVEQANKSVGIPNSRSSISEKELKEFSGVLELLIFNLLPAVEASCKLHPHLSFKLTVASAQCLLFSRCLMCSVQEAETCNSTNSLGQICKNALEGLAELAIKIEQEHCWQVASAIVDYLLKLPEQISVGSIFSSICYMIKYYCCHAPKISWRLRTDKWLSSLFMRGISDVDGSEDSLGDLFCIMLAHSEPEQRAIALQHLGRIVGIDKNCGLSELTVTFRKSLVRTGSVIDVTESMVSVLISSTWDRVTSIALSDPSLLLRTHAMVLLSGYIPFAKRSQVQSVLVASDTMLISSGMLLRSMEDSQLTRLSLVLLASACLYSPGEDISLIPEVVWTNLERIGSSAKKGLGAEKNLCQALWKLRISSTDSKEVLKEALLLDCSNKDLDPDLKRTRETILQVFSSLDSIKSYFDFFSKRIDQETQELEEAEIELALLQKERVLQQSSNDKMPLSSGAPYEGSGRLQQIKDNIRSLEKARLTEEIKARREKKLVMMKARQKHLDDAASREMELLQELDRERASEAEREIERQRLLEIERAKTRELRYSLDMERERLSQRELLRELEQVESGVRSSRREFSSNPNSRMRERARERDSGRPGQEGNLRSSSRDREGGGPQPASSGPGVSPSAPTIVLNTSSRAFSGHVPTILQSRDRTEDRNSVYEDNLEGNSNYGDTSSVGDPELGSAFEGMGGGFGPRHGSRGTKSRTVMDRRERDARREGKWERKHS